MSIVIIHGPAGSGKTRRAQALLQHYGCKRVVDEWDGRAPLNDGDLAITNIKPPYSIKGARLVDIATAKMAITSRVRA